MVNSQWVSGCVVNKVFAPTLAGEKTRINHMKGLSQSGTIWRSVLCALVQRDKKNRFDIL